MAKSKTKIPLAPASKQPFNNPLAGLGNLLPQAGLPVQAAAALAPAPVPDNAVPAQDLWRAQGKLVLRREKKGRGGKTVTVLSGLSGMDLQAVAQDLRKAMGCGAVVEGDTVILQGAQGERAAVWLQERGVRQVVVS